MKNGDIKVKQNSTAQYLECLLDEAMPEEAMGLEIINEINKNLTFHCNVVFDTSTEAHALQSRKSLRRKLLMT